MQDNVEHGDVNVERMASTLIARRRFLRRLTIAAGVGTLAASTPTKGSGATSSTCPTYNCPSGFSCGGLTFKCSSSFTCTGYST